jgi:NAD(P)-dependent dehydrogenase (short-subunit alcohol dehydrogenase family)
MRLEGKVALISGGARGLGEAQARLFAQEGARVVIGDVGEDEGKKVAAEINEAGGDAHFERLDVTQEDQWQRVLDTTTAMYGKLDILVNNAGISGGRIGLEDLTGEIWDQVMAVNAKGVFLGTKLAIPEMLKAGGGSIVNISSQMGIVGSDTSNPAYHASKGAVHIFTKAVALRYAKKGIRVNSIHPGPIQTSMLEPGFVGSERRRSAKLDVKWVMSWVPMGRAGQPMEVAYGVLFLASDESSFVTGEGLVIDGGYIAQ